MKKFSTAVLLMSLAVTALPLASASAGEACEWAPGAPDQHRVRSGDTLWELASVFLSNPWCWTRVWESNRALIRDPHWIYPGQIIVLDRLRGVLRLGTDAEDAAENSPEPTRLSPRVRTEPADPRPVPLLPLPLQRQLARFPLLGNDDLAKAPAIAALAEQRSMAGRGDTVIVRGTLGPATQFDVVRAAQVIRDPDSGEQLGIAGMRIGRVQLTSAGELTHHFIVTASSSELRAGDRLMPVADDRMMPQVLPHASGALPGKLAAILHDGRWATLHDRVALNLGARDGLDAGSVVRVVRHVRIGSHDSPLKLMPAADRPTIALLLVFDVAERTSLAFVMRASDAIAVGDIVLPTETFPR